MYKRQQALAAYEKFIETSSRFNRIRDDREDVRNKLRKLRNAPPDSPFRNDTYLDVSAKGVLRDAVMEGATAVAFSNAQRLIERWDRQYEKGYRFIYDNKMPAIFERLTGEKPLMMAPDNTLISDDDALWGTDPDTGKRVYTGNALWLVKIPPEVAQQIREDGICLLYTSDAADEL